MTGSATFRALVVRQADGAVSAAIEDMATGSLPEGEVTVDVQYSSLNYKDGLVLRGLGGLVKTYPHVPGIDLAGTVAESAAPIYRKGDAVIATGWFIGERHWGGYARKARLKADWLVPLPAGLTAKRAMAIGTAGFAAMQAIVALEAHGLAPDKGEVLVTGAGGGLGSVAVAVLAKLGYQVAASTGRVETHDYLTRLGAASIIDRKDLATPSERPLDKERWAAAIDSVGGETLATVLRQVRYGGSVAACGLAGGNALPTTVLPFILRAVNLLGIDSVQCPAPLRRRIWDRLATDVPMDKLDAATTVAPLGALVGLAHKILKGEVRGRTVVDVNA
ncbi:MAG: MDR family oxidoreductase [Alphaproteobacteria bacterium]